MNFKLMSARDQEIIGECLRAAPIFLAEDLQTVTGVEEDRFQTIADLYPDVDSDDEDVELAIHGAMLNLIGYPHGMFNKWADFISVPPEQVTLIFKRWQALNLAKN